MHRFFQDFIDRLSSTPVCEALRDAVAKTAAAFDLSCFAYLSIPFRTTTAPQLISNYPAAWTTHYLQSHHDLLIR